MVQVTVLIDNTASDNPLLHHEHGLSLLVRTDEQQLLLDTGRSGRAIDNALAMGIDVKSIDTLVLSHGHNDHTGGLKRFLENNNKAPVYASGKIFGRNYSSSRGGLMHPLSPDIEVLRQYRPRFRFLDKDCQIVPGVHLVFCSQATSPRPYGNRHLHVTVNNKVMPYEPDDELAIAIAEPDGLVVLSACSHCGVLNIIASCVKATGITGVKAFVGGTHLLDGEGDNAEGIARELGSRYPGIDVATGHCTGIEACEAFSRALGERFHHFATADTLVF